MRYTSDDYSSEFIRGGWPCENPNDWNRAVNFLKRLLTLAGFNTDMDSWINFSTQMEISSYYTVFFHSVGPELDNIVGNTLKIYQWLESLRAKTNESLHQVS